MMLGLQRKRKRTYKEYEVEYKQEDFDAFSSSFHSHDWGIYE